MFDKILEIFSETILYSIYADDFHYFLFYVDFILSVLLVAVVAIFNKKIGRKRAVTITVLTMYNFIAFGASSVCRWWIGIIVAALCFFWVRSWEKRIWKDEIKQKKIDGELNDLLISPKGIILNMILSFALAQLIILIVTF